MFEIIVTHLCVFGIVLTIGLLLIHKATLILDEAKEILKSASKVVPQYNGPSVFRLGDIELDDVNVTHSLRHDEILIPIGVFVGILDDLYRHETRQEKLDDIMEYLREQESEYFQEIPDPTQVTGNSTTRS